MLAALTFSPPSFQFTTELEIHEEELKVGQHKSSAPNGTRHRQNVPAAPAADDSGSLSYFYLYTHAPVVIINLFPHTHTYPPWD